MVSDFDLPFMLSLLTIARYEGNPCNGHLLGLGQRVKRSIAKAGIVGYQFGTAAVSDGISMGTFGSKCILLSYCHR